MAIGTTLTIGFDSRAVQRGLAGLKSKIGSISASLVKMGAAAVTASLAVAAAGMAAFAVSSSKAAAEIEGMRTAFTVLTGSAEKANKVLEEIREFGATTPLEQKDLQQSAQTLLAFGVSLEEVMPTLRMLGDVSMGNAEKLGSLALVFGQVSSAGKLTGGDLLQFINVGFNPLNQIAARTGKTMGELRDMMSKGAITTAMVKQAFVDATTSGGMFEGMLAKMAETTEGKLSNMSDNIAAIKVAFGTGINGGLRSATDALNVGLPRLVQKFAALGTKIGNAISDAVAGNYDKFIAIGELIGTILTAGASKTFKTGIRNLGATVLSGVDSAENFIRDSTGLSNLIGNSDLGARATSAAGTMSAEDTRQMANAIRLALEPVMQGNQGLVPGTNGRFQYAPAGSTSPLSDGNGNRVILSDINKNIKALLDKGGTI